MADDREEGLGVGEGEGEEFSFPSIVGSSPCSIDSPPWLYSPSNHTSLEPQQEDDESRVDEESREKNGEGGGVVGDVTIRDGSREEKMDMLWEDFNEELWGSVPTDSEKQLRELGGGKTGSSKRRNERGGAVSSQARRPGATAFVRALRKLFLLRRRVVAAPGPGSIKTRPNRAVIGDPKHIGP